MELIVPSGIDNFVIRNTEVNGAQGSLTRPAHFAEPLMGHDEIRRYRYGKDAARYVAGIRTDAYTTVSDGGDILIGRDVHKESHTSFPIAPKTGLLKIL